jgi:endonuclease/exonuclease/phosphatase (EEP) superfamily protein YafD
MSCVVRYCLAALCGLLLTACLEIPSDEVIYSHSGEQLIDRCNHIPARQGFPGGLPDSFNVLVWNIYKLQAADWSSELVKWGANNDLLLLQEATDAPALNSWLSAGQWRWQQVAAFRFKERTAGVLTAGLSVPVYSCSLRTPEPSTRIPKSTLLSLYPLQGSRYPLMVVNVHGINFELGMAAYKKQLEQIGKLTRRYQGPVIVAGDFNTWSDKRLVFLYQVMGRYKLQEVSYSPDERLRVGGVALDHVFSRGLTVTGAQSMHSTGSDHNPIRIGFHYP